MAGNGRIQFELSEVMKSIDKKQIMASNHEFYSQMRKAAFLSGNQYYEINNHNHTDQELKAAISESAINYFYYFYKNDADLKAFQQTFVYRNSSSQKHFPGLSLMVVKM